MEYEVTIGMPVYQVEKYIRDSLESALSQTFPSIEFLICDDCGTDSSIAIVQEYLLRLKGITFILWIQMTYFLSIL